MAAKFFEKDEFKKLQKAWKQKLERSGFKDLEPNEGDQLPGQFYIAREIKRPERMISAQEYFCQASKFYWDFTFKNKRHKEIWFYHSEGLSIRAIVECYRNENYSSIRKVLEEIRPIFLQYVKAQWEYNEND